MSEERTRILRMLAAGTISIDECEELLHALSDRRTEKVEREVAAAKGKRPVWPYVLVVILAIVALPMWGFGIGRIGGSIPGIAGRMGILGILLTIFWIVMLIDCIKRRKEDFRLLLTQNHEHEKWIWCGVVLLGNWVGALAYYIIIRQAAQSIAPPMARKVHESEPGGETSAETEGETPQVSPPAPVKPEEPFTPSPRARSLLGFFLWGVLFMALLATMAAIAPSIWPDAARTIGLYRHALRNPANIIGLFLTITMPTLMLWIFIFWIWMLIDCLARDYREFGTLVTSDKSLDKIVWLLLILFTFVIGGLAYHISVRRRRRPIAGTA